MPQTHRSQFRASLEMVTNETQDIELIAPTDARAPFISVNSARVSGAACFAGTHVPIQHLWDYLEAGEPLDEFLEGFPGVAREPAVGTLESAFRQLMASLPKT